VAANHQGAGGALVALLTCHNRRETTLRCLESLFGQHHEPDSLDVQAVVVDDGSSDGTADAIRARFDRATVIDGPGDLYWARGMQLAEAHALARQPEHLLWLNDDVVLDPGALGTLLATASMNPDAIVVGALRDPEAGTTTYSGVTRSRWHPLRTTPVEPEDAPREADTFNGNVVLVRRVLAERVGGIDGGFSHSQADFDYGLRARKLGIDILVAPGTIGTCPRGSLRGTFRDVSLPFRRRWELMQGPKGLPLRSHRRFLRRHGGMLWPVFWIAPYLRLVVSALKTAPTRWRGRG
jgi:GT2 family glycosyltransferase